VTIPSRDEPSSAGGDGAAEVFILRKFDEIEFVEDAPG
jgi:hypothetical protein